MTDQELLTAAAKAADIYIIPYTWDKGAPWGEHDGFIVGDEGPDEWNPLEDDAQALRLAAKLYLWEAVRMAHRLVGEEGCPDIYAATRRAIVLAAAAMAEATSPR